MQNVPESNDLGTFFSCMAPKAKSMKTRNIAIIIFCFFCGAALIATLHIRSKISGRSLELQWKATLDDLDTHSSAAHIQSLRYDSYARQAATENDHTRQKLFLALAHSERIHEQMCKHATELFGGNYSAPYAGADLSTTTAENLRRSIDSARSQHSSSQGSAATRAIESGNRYVARILIWIDGCNRRHIELLEHAYDSLTASTGYLVCPKCGNTYHTESYDRYCPFCQTHHSDFKRF